jgi:hypothetical protein
MRKIAILLICVLCGPALAGTYPVSGKWGVSTRAEKGLADCSKLRVIAFSGDQRTDSNGGVPAYRNKSVTAEDATHFRIVDEFSTGQISGAHVSYTLDKIDADHIVLNMQPGGMLKLQRCK